MRNHGWVMALALLLGLCGAPGQLEGQQFKRGDGNGDSVVDIADPIYVLSFLFTGGPDPSCYSTADGNDDGLIDIADPIFLLGHLFTGTGPLPAPFQACGEDPTPDSLTCIVYAPCGTFPAPPEPPVLDPYAAAVTTPTATVTGSSNGVAVRVASSLGQSQIPVVGGTFTATDIPLEPDGITTIFFSTIGVYGNSSATVTATIAQDSSPPVIVISSPADGAVVTAETFAVQGQIQDLLADFDTLTVTVDGAPVTLSAAAGGFGSFYQSIGPIPPATPTDVVIQATDPLGNTSSATITVTYEVPPGPRLSLISGNGQTATVETELADPIVLRVTQPDGSAFANKIVNLQVTASNGRLRLTPGGTESIALNVISDAQGYVNAWWRLGADTGAGEQQVTAASSGIEDIIVVSATGMSAPPDKIVVATGSAQVLPVSSETPAPLVALVTDPSGNPIAGVDVTFTAQTGESQVRAEGGSPGFSVTTQTDILGRAKAYAILDEDEGAYIFKATFAGNAGLPASFQVNGVASAFGQPATFTGVVLSNASQPITGAEVTLRFPVESVPFQASSFLEFSTFTDANGAFSISGIDQFGPARLDVDGLTATGLDGTAVAQGSFPCLEFQVVVVEGGENELGMPAFLPELNPQNARSYDGVQDLPLNIESIPGVEIMVPAGTTILDEDGNPFPLGGILALNRVNFDKIPMPLPDGAISSFAWTLQPARLHFDPPLPVTLPNFGGLPAGTTVNMVSFNHSTHRFESFGPGRVSADGATVSSDPGFGIEISGWGAPLPPPPPPAEVHNCAGLELWGLTKDGGDTLSDVLGYLVDLDSCLADTSSVLFNLETAIADFSVAAVDGVLTEEEIAPILSTLEGVRAQAEENKACLGSFPLEIKLVKAQQLDAALAAAIAEAEADGCIPPGDPAATVAQAEAGQAVALLSSLIADLDARIGSLVSACADLFEAGALLQSPAPVDPGLISPLLTSAQAGIQAALASTPDTAAIVVPFESGVAALGDLCASLQTNPELAGATLTCAGQSVVANSGGGFSIGNIPSGPSLLRVEATLETPGGAEFGSSECFILGPGEQRLIGPIALSPNPVEVVGLELSISPSAIPLGSTGVVTVLATYSDGSVVDVSTDSCLSVSISNTERGYLVPGTNEIETTAVGIFYVSALYEGTIASALASGIYPVPPTTDIVGVVTSSNGAPVSGAIVSLLPGTNAVVTGGDGTFLFAGILTDDGPFQIDIDLGTVVSEPFEGVEDGITDAGVFVLGSGTELFVLGASGGANTTVTSSVVLDTTEALGGWSYSVCHDPTQVEPLEIWSASATLTANGGSEPDFITLNLDPAVGVAQGVVISLLGQNVLPPGVSYPLANMTYLLGSSAGSSTICPCDLVGTPPVVTVLATPTGSTLPVGQNCGTVTINP